MAARRSTAESTPREKPHCCEISEAEMKCVWVPRREEIPLEFSARAVVGYAARQRLGRAGGGGGGGRSSDDGERPAAASFREPDPASLARCACHAAHASNNIERAAAVSAAPNLALPPTDIMF